jgi:hypothetical protein
VNSSDTWLDVACKLLASAGRIGSTSPMPMNETTQANATAQTARGCLNGLGATPCAAVIGRFLLEVVFVDAGV